MLAAVGLLPEPPFFGVELFATGLFALALFPVDAQYLLQ